MNNTRCVHYLIHGEFKMPNCEYFLWILFSEYDIIKVNYA